MRPASIPIASLFAVGGVVPAGLLVAALAAVHAAHSPECIMDAAYVAAFCGLGYLAG